MTHFGRETIGAAYIRVLADMSDFDKSTREGFDASAKEHRKQGERVGEEFAKGREEGIDKHPLGDKIVKEFDKAKPRLEKIEKDLGHDFSNRVVQQVGDEKIGERIANKIEKGLLAGRIKPADIKRILPGLIVDETQRWIDELDKLNSRLHGPDLPNWAKGATSAEKAVHALTTEAERLRAKLGKPGDDRTGFLADTIRNSEKAATGIEKFSTAIGKGFGAGSRNNFFNAIGSITGGMIGMIGVLPQATKLIATFLDKITTSGGNAQQFGADVEQSSSAIGQMAVKLISQGIPGLIALVGIMSAVVVGAGVLASALSLLAAAAVALTSAVAVGLIGAIGAAAPLLLALAASMGVFVLAFTGLSAQSKISQKNLTTANTAVKTYTKQVQQATPGTAAYAKATANLAQAQKDQAAAQGKVNTGILGMVQPLKTWFHTAQNIAAVNLFKNLGADIATVTKSGALAQINTLIGGIARALGGIGTGFANVIASPGFQAFLTALNKTLPGILTSLGQGFNSVFSGLGGLFRALLPFGQLLANAFRDIAGRFADWANSAKGQSAISRFMNEAWTTAKKLWKTISDLAKIIGDLFFNPGAKKTGGGFLDSINSSLERFDRWLKSDKGRAALKKWFEDAKTFIHNVGVVLDRVVKLFDKLDSPTNRRALQLLLQALGILVGFITTTVGGLGQLAGIVIGIFNGISSTASTFIKKLDGIFSWFDVNRLGKLLTGWGKALLDLITWPFRAAYNYLVGNSLIPDLIRAIVFLFQTIPTGIAKALIGVVPAITRPFIQAAGSAIAWAARISSGVVSWMGGVAGRVGSALGGVAGAIGGALANAYRTAVQWAGSIAHALGGLAGNAAGAVAGALGGVWNAFNNGLAGIWGLVRGWVGDILSQLGRLAGSAASKFLHLAIPFLASGGIVVGPTTIVAGEAGPEAIVPLNRPLSQVDPAVRSLSAIAQGKPMDNSVTGKTPFGTGTYVAKNIDVGGITVVAPVEDTRAVAQMVVNRLVSAGYS